MNALANKWPPVLLYAFPPFPLLPAFLAKVRIVKAKVLLVAPDWPQQSWMPDLIALLRGSPWCLPSQTGHTVSGPRSDLRPEFREVQVAHLATRRESARNLGEAILTTLQAAKAPSTRQLYASRWERFSR